MSATREATGHSPLPWYFDDLRKEVYAHDKGFVCGFGVSPYMQEHELQVCQADAQLIVTAVNERERLREILRLTDALIVKLYDEDAIPNLMQYEVDGLRGQIHAALSDQNE